MVGYIPTAYYGPVEFHYAGGGLTGLGERWRCSAVVAVWVFEITRENRGVSSNVTNAEMFIARVEG